MVKVRPLAAIGVTICLLGGLGAACQLPLPAARAPTPTSAAGSLTDAEAIALVKEEIGTCGVAPNTVRIAMAEEPRRVSIRYASSYDVDSRVFQAQTVLVALAAARVMARVDPPISGGMRVAVLPVGESNIGLRVTVVHGPSLEAWANGSISDQEFVRRWSVGIVTRE
jgi:hypothetical protein